MSNSNEPIMVNLDEIQSDPEFYITELSNTESLTTAFSVPMKTTDGFDTVITVALEASFGKRSLGDTLDLSSYTDTCMRATIIGRIFKNVADGKDSVGLKIQGSDAKKSATNFGMEESSDATFIAYVCKA